MSARRSAAPACPTCGHAMTCMGCAARRGGMARGGRKAQAARANAEKARQARAEQRTSKPRPSGG